MINLAIALFFGLASAAAVGFAALSPFDAKRKTFVALLIFAGWSGCNFTYQGNSLQWWITFDGIMAMLCVFMWLSRRARWLRYLYYTYLAQLIAHCLDRTALATGLDMGYAYSAALNFLFLCQLYILSNTGIGKLLDGDRDRHAFAGRRTRGDSVFPKIWQRH